MEKLFGKRDAVPENVIGMMNVPSRERAEQLVEMAKNISNIENSLLIFRTYSAGRNRGFFDEVHAFLFEKNKVMDHKFAYVSEVAGTLFMHFEPRAALITHTEDVLMK